MYDTYCSPCHGPDGKGDGDASPFLFPKPRDLTRGRFKFRSTRPGSPPTDDDLLSTLVRGIPGSSMPGFGFLTEAELRSILEYVKTLSPARTSAAGQTRTPVAIGAPPPRTRAALEAGRRLYVKLQCSVCHGSLGQGDGPIAQALRDESGLPIRPRDFTTGIFKGGSTARDIYLRITTGVDGTPMPALGERDVSSQARWELAYYVQSLRQVPGSLGPAQAPARHVLLSTRVKGTLPKDDPLSTTWRGALPYRIPMHRLWERPGPSPNLLVRSLNDEETIAFLLDWPDATPNKGVARPEDFRDAAAIQFFRSGGHAFFGMGERHAEVNIWHWKADWQAQVDSGRREDVASVYPAMSGSTSPLPAAAAREVGNPFSLATRSSPVEDASARGFGTLTSRPLGYQAVTGKGVWSDGRWRVVFSRSLRATGEDFRLGQSGKIAFAVWDGAHADRGGEKAISSWYYLQIRDD